MAADADIYAGLGEHVGCDLEVFSLRSFPAKCARAQHGSVVTRITRLLENLELRLLCGRFLQDCEQVLHEEDVQAYRINASHAHATFDLVGVPIDVRIANQIVGLAFPRIDSASGGAALEGETTVNRQEVLDDERRFILKLCIA